MTTRPPALERLHEDFGWTPRQRQVLDLLAKDRSNAEIAAELGISLDGAKWHVREVLTKLGAESRDEAAEYWRAYNGWRLRFSQVVGGVFGAGRWKVVGAGAAMITATVAIAALVGVLFWTRSDEDRPTAHEIVERSGGAMGTLDTFLVTEARHSERPWQPSVAVSVFRYEGRKGTELTVPEGDECHSWQPTVAPYTQRTEGGPQTESGLPWGTGPDGFELLDDTEISGEPAWVVRYSHMAASEEGQIPREHTEWISKEDYRLVRAEVEQHDPWGFVGIAVQVFDYERTADCPTGPWLDDSELQPLTEITLEAPGPLGRME